MAARADQVGFQVGQQLAERYAKDKYGRSPVTLALHHACHCVLLLPLLTGFLAFCVCAAPERYLRMIWR